MPDGRYQLLDTPILSPGACLLTGSVGPVIDTGYTIEWFPANAIRPRVYLSVDAIREMADIAGVRTVKSASERVDETAVYNRGFADAVRERVGDQLVELVDRLGFVAALLGSSDLSGPGDDAGLEGAGEEPGDGLQGEPEPDPAVPGPGNRTGGKRRRADVPGNPGLGAA